MTHRDSPGIARLPATLVLMLAAALGIWTLLLGFAALGIDLPDALVPLTAPSSLAAALGYLLLLAALVMAVLVRSRDPRRGGLVNSHLLTVSGVIAVIAATLGAFAYAGCEPDLPVLWHAYWVLELFVGFVIDPATAQTCPVFPSLAIQIARLLALTALFGGGAAAFTLALRGRFSQGRLAWDPAARYFVGVDEQSFPLLAGEVTDKSRRGRVYVVSPEANSQVIATARSLGAVYVDGLGDDPQILQRALRRPWFSGRHNVVGLSQFACLSSDTDANLALFRELAKLLSDSLNERGAGEERLAITIRIDEVHRAECWWRQHAQAISFGHSAYTVDIVGLYDSTARHIVNSIRTDVLGRPAIVVDGDNSMALALVKQLAREASWGSLLRDLTEETELKPLVVLTGEWADEVERDARSLWDLDALELRAVTGIAAWQVDRDGLGADCVFAVLSDTGSDGYLHGERTAERLRARRVWVIRPIGSSLSWTPRVYAEMTDRPAESQCEVVRIQPLAIAESREDRLSTWELAAWHVAQLYEPHNTTLRAKPTQASIHDNLRAVLNVGSLARQQGLTWGPAHRTWRGGLCCRAGKVGDGHDPDCLFDRLCAQEHAAWRRQRESEGWTYGPTKLDPPVSQSPLIVDWADLSEPGKASGIATRYGTYRTVEDVLEVLRVLGLSPWWLVSRTGAVQSAIRLDREIAVPSSRGTQRGKVGDWLLRDGIEEWVVNHEGFARHYDVGASDSREYNNVSRVGVSLLARPAMVDESIESYGASMKAQDGDWIARDAGVQWLIPGPAFERSYRLSRGG